MSCLLGALAALAEDPEPWLEGAFAAAPAEIARAAGAVPSGLAADVVMLWRDEHYAFDTEGRMTHRRRWIYRILTPAGLEGWSLSEAAWSPWFQARPEVRARSIGPDGAERWLDESRRVELTAEETGLSGDRRLLRAPLPVTVGAVVEEEVVLRDEQPYFAGGISAKHLLLMPVPIVRGRLTVEVPTALPLRYAVRGTPEIVPQRSKKAGVLTLRFDYAGMPAAQPVEEAMPPDEPRYPHIAFSTGQNWAAVADAYGAAVDEAIAGSDAAEILRRLPNEGSVTQIDRIAELLEGVRSSLRYEPLDLGTAGVIPATPLATLERGAGDGKDLATVLAAVLRQEGIPAYVALVRAGYGKDLDPGLPGLGRFNHALVYVPAGEPLWLDPTDPWSRAGQLASDREGRLALVTSPNTRRLIRTPVPSARDNLTRTQIEVFLADDGPARVLESSVYHGAAERRQRLVTAQVDAEERRLGYEAYVKAAYKAEALGRYEETAVDDFSAPFRLRLEALRASRGFTTEDRAAVAIDSSYLLTALPRELLISGGGPRRGSFVFHEPFLTEWRYRIEAPKRLRPGPLPVDRARDLGGGRFSRTVRRKGSEVQVTLRLDSGPRRLTAAQFEAFRSAVQELLLDDALVLEFER
ncbi:MAG: DUF3857 domain-containing protein [Acidobacteriota bacterium]